MMTQDQLVSYLKFAKVGQLQSLITTLEEELGVTAAHPSLVVPLTRPEPEPDKTEFDVVLTGFEGKKVDVIKAVRKITGLGLKEAKAVVEGAPTPIREAVERQTADELAAELRAASATVEVR